MLHVEERPGPECSGSHIYPENKNMYICVTSGCSSIHNLQGVTLDLVSYLPVGMNEWHVGPELTLSEL